MSAQPPGVAEIEVTGVVRMVCDRGRVPYVVVIPDEEPAPPKEFRGGDVTFSLVVWKDPIPPQAGQLVVLSQFREFDKGWRAMSARPIGLSD